MNIQAQLNISLFNIYIYIYYFCSCLCGSCCKSYTKNRTEVSTDSSDIPVVFCMQMWPWKILALPSFDLWAYLMNVIPEARRAN